MKKVMMLFLCFILLASFAAATDFDFEYQKNYILYDSYATQMSGTFSDVDNCILRNSYSDPCFDVIQAYVDTTLVMNKNGLGALKDDIIDLKHEYVSVGGSSTDSYSDQLEYLMDSIDSLVNSINNKINIIGSYTLIKSVEKFEDEIVVLEQEHTVIEDQLENAGSESEFNEAQTALDELQVDIDSLQEEVTDVCSGSAECGSVVNDLSTLENEIIDESTLDYGDEIIDTVPDTNVPGTDTPAETGFSGEDLSSDDVESLLQDYLAGLENKESGTSLDELKLILDLLKELEDEKSKLADAKATTTDPTKLAELEGQENKNSELQQKIGEILKGGLSGDETDIGFELIEIKPSEDGKIVPQSVIDIIGFLILGIALLGFLYFFFKFKIKEPY